MRTIVMRRTMSSGVYRRVGLVTTDVSKERVSLVFMVERIRELHRTCICKDYFNTSLYILEVACCIK
jgi:hypothetical protein